MPSLALAKISQIQLAENQSKLFEFDSPISNVYVANSQYAKVHSPSNNSILIRGLKLGKTDVVVFGANDKTIAHYQVQISADLSRLEMSALKHFPDASISFQQMGTMLIVSGEVNTPLQANEVLNMAQGFAKTHLKIEEQQPPLVATPKTGAEGTAVGGGGIGNYQQVINKLTIAGSDQINISVRIIEMQRSTSEQLGLRWNAVGEYLALGVSPGKYAAPLAAVGAIEKKNINAIIDALVQNSLVNVLAEPNLTAKSGETATFMSGGEFPIPVDNSDDGITIEFKKFGISLELTPTLLSANRISLTVSPEVSTISHQNSVTLNGVSVPGIEARRTTTTVELADGQSFALAGMIRTYRNHKVEALPILGEIPFLAPFFSTNSYTNAESELVIIATARLVQPTSSAGNLSSPLDSFRAPSRFERLFFGELANKDKPRLFGQYGYNY
ncbi:type II and III secretion system protein family protein [Psychromonas sp. Urea-02u-13]|uniref:type II and III secretion system protein family protein n=1 Tax=Psychromonas sp. Urea-02u-13 TaxID=2058326 RepID=UPI0022B7D77F|nr:type II and III secretion system protein family protein [Psychromonas sp. Urea-02u-13]